MGIYDAFKDALSIAQKADNIELYQKLLDLSNQAIELQNEVYELTEANRKLKLRITELQKTSIVEEDLELLPDGYLIRKSEKESGKNVIYCAACWQNYKKLMPYTRTIGNKKQCNNCHSLLQ